MLRLTVDSTELFDQEKQEFSEVGGFIIEFEHSLVSVSKWEAKYQEPFLDKKEKTPEGVLDYLKFMIISDTDSELIERLTSDHVKAIQEYIGSNQTATTFTDLSPKGSGGVPEIVTSDLIYYWMTVAQIDISCENWHLNRLLTLIRICSLKSQKQKHMPRHEAVQRMRDLNEQRKRELGTRG